MVHTGTGWYGIDCSQYKPLGYKYIPHQETQVQAGTRPDYQEGSNQSGLFPYLLIEPAHSFQVVQKSIIGNYLITIKHY